MPPHFGVAQEINSWSLYKPDPWTFEPADVERNTWRDGLLRKKVHRGAKKTPQEERWSHQASQGQEGKGRQDGAAIQLRRWARSVTQTGALLMHRQRTYWSSQIGAEVTQSISGRCSRARPVSTIKKIHSKLFVFYFIAPDPTSPVRRRPVAIASRQRLSPRSTASTVRPLSRRGEPKKATSLHSRRKSRNYFPLIACAMFGLN